MADHRCKRTGETVFVWRRGIRKADLVYRVEVIDGEPVRQSLDA